MEDDPPQDEPDEFDGVFDNAPSIEQISEATKWPALQKSRPEDYAEEFPTASCRRRRSSKFAELLGVAMGVAICIILAFLIAWLPFAIFSICMFLGYV